MANPAYRQPEVVSKQTGLSFADLSVKPQFAPWSLPAALGLMLGVVAGRLGLLAPLLVAGVLVAGVAFLLRSRLLLALALCLPLGYARFSLWSGQENRLEPLYNQTLTLSGHSDGRILTLDEPAGVRVAVSPQGALEPGWAHFEGELVRASGKRNPGGFDYAGYLRRRGVWGQVFVEEVLEARPAPPSLKARLQRGVTAGLGERQAALMQAMTLGVRDDLGELREVFAASGLAHVLALSGLHIGILVAALNVVLLPLGLRRYPLLIVLIVGYVFLVGFSPSVVRAGTMAVALLASYQLGAGRIDVWASLALSACLSLLFSPSWLFDISFQLSYLAVAGILLFAPPLLRLVLGERLSQAGAWHPASLTVGAVVVSLAAQLPTLPLIVSSFGSLPLFGTLVNIPALPLASALVPLGFLAGVLGLVSPTLAGVLNGLTGLFAGLLVWVAELGSKLPQLIWGEVSWLGYALFYIALAAFALALYGQLKLWRALLICLVAGLCTGLTPPRYAAPEVVFLDVGQGDAVLIRLPNRQEILIDAGGTPFSDFDVGGRTVLPALKALGVDELELVIASHSDADHMEGLVSVLDGLPVNRLLIGARTDDPLFKRLMWTAEAKDVPVTQVARGQQVALGEARLDILGPPRKLFEKDNDNSVTFVLNYAGRPKALFMGDLSVDAERGMAFPQVNIVMAGHHGSNTSTSAELLAATQPKHVIFSYGRNAYGHPANGALERVAATGARVHHTYLQGVVRLNLE